MALLVGRAATLVVAGAVTLVLTATPAHAEVVTYTDGSFVVIESDEPVDVVTMTCVDDEANVNDDSAEPVLACDAVTNVLVDAEDGATTVSLGGVTRLAFPLLARTSIDVADSDTDSITGSEARDVVRADLLDEVSAGPGDDWVEGAGIASGGEGNDTLREIADEAWGGSGDDLIVGGPASLIDGGSGFDRVVIDYAAFTGQTTVSLSITDASINGATETAGIEAYDVTASDGLRNDSINSAFYSGRVTFRGRDGNDTFLGGPGADTADGGQGNDTLDAGTGSDFLLGGDGDDTFSTRDGFGDVVECGPGLDSVTADRADVLSGCESVALPALPPPPPPDTGAIGGPKRVTKGTKAFFTFGASVAGATFECQVDSGALKPCASPFKLRTRKLDVGRHTLSVRAVHAAGGADPTPSTFRFKVKAKPKVRSTGSRVAHRALR